jgi:hypothetical protein
MPAVSRMRTFPGGTQTSTFRICRLGGRSADGEKPPFEDVPRKDGFPPIAAMRRRRPDAPSAAAGFRFPCPRLGPGMFDIDPEIPDSALDLGVTKRDLHRSQIARLFIDKR